MRIYRNTAGRCRRGVAALWTVVVLAVLAAMLGMVTVQLLSTRRNLDRQWDQAQGLWLARAGVEVAAGRLLTDPEGYAGESPEILQDWQLRVGVEKDRSVTNTYLVTSTARRQDGKSPPTLCLVSRRFRRSVENGRVRLEVVPRSIEPFQIP